MSFVHLHVHSQYSLLEASCTGKAVAKQAAKFEQPAVAITDNGNMFGAVEFYFACQSAGVKPIIGLDAYIAPQGRLVKTSDRDQRQPNRRLVLLAQDYKGYQNLCQLSSIAYKEGFYYKPRIDFEVLEKYSENIIALTGGVSGEVAWNFLNKGKDEALESVKYLKKLFGDRLYLEVCKTGDNRWDQLNPFLQEVGEAENIPLVATNNVHYLVQDDQLAQEVLICIGSNKTLQDDSRFRLGSDQFYLKSTDQMKQLFSDMPEAIENTVKVAERCNVEFKLQDDEGRMIYHLPTYPTSDGRDLKQEMLEVSQEGLKERFEESRARGEKLAEEEEYNKRLDYELSVIEGMGFNGYFLIVQDFIKWAKKNDIPVGPGRGSGAGSLVAYCLRITDLDPLQHGLIFERFLNPERISMPDFDIDFCQERRAEVIQYVTEKYGQASVSQIITYGKLQARAAIRDVGRVLGMTYGDVDAVAKLIPDKLGINLKEALEMEPRIGEQMELDPQVNNLMSLAQKVEGLVRHAGIHAAGVIIADGELVSHAPLYRGVDGENVVQYDMKHSEKIGLIKFDFLGLKTLTHIQYSLNMIKKNRNKVITTQDISLTDKGIYEIMSAGDNLGIFQFEGEGISETTKNIKPTCFADITAINALYRPGPMGMIPTYTARMHGEEDIEYLFPELEEILKETYGIIVYQEQVQLIAAKIASYSLGEADMLRRAMGKKIKEEMDKQRIRFLDGAKNNGFDKKKAEELFDLMYKFAEYGFNKSHAAAYCVIAGQTAWLKNYYTVEFFAGLLTTELSNTDNVVRYVKDAQKHGIVVKPPHINVSEYQFTVANDELYFGLGAIKGVGEGPVNAIVAARKEQPSGEFENLEDFFMSVDSKVANKKVIECLIKAGALDGFDAHRSELFEGYQRFIESAEQKKRDREMGQFSLFDVSPDQESHKVTLDKKPPWTRSVRLAFEKEVLGFYLSDHPLRGFENLIRFVTTEEIAKLPEVVKIPEKSDNWKNKNKAMVEVAGLISGLKELITKKGTRMAFAQIEDLNASMELVIFPDAYAQLEQDLKTDAPVVITGAFEFDKGNYKILVEDVRPLEATLKKARSLTLDIQEPMFEKIKSLKSILAEHPGEANVKIHLRLNEPATEVLLEVSDPPGVNISNHLFETIHGEFGDTSFISLN